MPVCSVRCEDFYQIEPGTDMSTTMAISVSSEPQLEIIENNRQIVEAELHRLLGEKRFTAAPQMSAFLRYIVTETLEGRGDRIKAYTVGVDALGKSASFDAQDDPSVRVLALRLRKALDFTYNSNTPHYAIVSLRVGSYRPMFYKASKPACQSIGNQPNHTQSSMSDSSAQVKEFNHLGEALNGQSHAATGTDSSGIPMNTIPSRSVQNDSASR